MADPTSGLLDTSVVIDLDRISVESLPEQMAISTITLAELTSGPHAAEGEERVRRQDRLQRVEAGFVALPFDADAARAYGRVYAAVAASGRKPRGARTLDLLIAAVACAQVFPCTPAIPMTSTL